MIENSDLKLSPRYERAFRAIWNQPSDRLKAGLLCDAVKLGTSGGFRPDEVKGIAFDKLNGTYQWCVVEWQWAFDNRRDEASRKQLADSGYGYPGQYALPLLPYGFDPESPLQENTMNAVFELYDSDSKMDAAQFPLGLLDNRLLLNLWRLRRYCEAHARDGGGE